MTFTLEVVEKGLLLILESILNRRGFCSEFKIDTSLSGDIQIKYHLEPDIDFFQSEEVLALEKIGLKITNCHYYYDTKICSLTLKVFSKQTTENVQK